MKIIMKNNSIYILLIITFTSIFYSCQEEYLPKPKGYNKLDLPSHEYQTLAEKHPYVFQYSKHAEILKDTSLISEPHWIDIYYPSLQCNVQLTYKKLKGKTTNFDEHINDSHKLANKHNIKAYSIEEGEIITKKGYGATVFELTGEVPSQFQFYVTDSSKHFLRGALYFKTSTKNDSLQPAINFIKYDIIHLLNSLEWTE